MRVFRLIVFVLLVAVIAGGVNAKVTISNLKMNLSSNQIASVIVEFDDKLKVEPEVMVRGNLIQVSIPDSVVWPKIEKKVSVLNKDKTDTTLMAYQYNKGTVRVRTILPFNIEKSRGNVDLTLKGNSIVLAFPITKSSIENQKTAPVIKKVSKSLKNKTAENDPLQYDESYLNQLINEKDEKKTVAKIDKGGESFDSVSLNTSALEKPLLKTNSGKEKSKFSLMSYIGKFVAFIGAILLLFYGVIFLMRKGVLKKGKLGFLNDTSVITVLNTTYLAPKRSLMLVKVHEQVFLLSSTEKGIEYLSEVDDTTGLMKQGEKEVVGTNFDQTLGGENLNEKKNIVLKKDINQSKPLEEMNPLLKMIKKGSSGDKVKFSDQLKKIIFATIFSYF